jgi:tripeptidyl-peptidase-1
MAARNSLLFGVLCSLLYATTVLASPLTFIDRKTPMDLPHGWKLHSVAEPTDSVRITLALKQRNIDRFYKIFNEITDPKSEKYAQYWTISDLTEMIAPSDETIQKVHDWLDLHSITKREMTTNKDFITISVPISKAEHMFDVQFFKWEHETGRKLTATLGPYTAPGGIASSLDFVVGSMGLPRMETVIRLEEELRQGEQMLPISPMVLRERYNISRNSIGGNPANYQSVSAFMDNFYNPTDIADFFAQFWPNKEYTDQVMKTVGANKPNEPTLMASVGLEYIMGVAPKVSTWFWSNPGSDFWGDLTGWVNQLSMDESTPPVHIMTYGNQGDGPSQEYRDRLTIELAKLGGRGVSVLVSSGDFGTGCYVCYYFEPSFPATSPYVTSVGATSFLEAKIGPEGGARNFKSGGGFSWNFEQPSYQAAVVTHYFATQKQLPATHYYNAYGRGIPDVSAVGSGYQVILNGKNHEYSGTAASTATFGGIISLLNEIRLSHNQRPLGFLNPWLYSISLEYPDSFYDVTEGYNGYGCCFSGFYASSGWDPVTGLGTPNYWILSKIVQQKHLGLRPDLDSQHY